MMKRVGLIVLIIFGFIYLSSAMATIINVPGDSTTIQAGINGSANGDTVLVQPGTYLENINFTGRNIVLGSLYLTTDDTSYISSTIIDGDSSGCVVTFIEGEDSTAVITGFTITKGLGGGAFPSYIGGGITCKNSSSPRILKNKVIVNSAVNLYGGGIMCWDNCNPDIIDNLISGNTSWIGAGVYCYQNCNPVISNNTISGNIASNSGGGISCFEYSDAQIGNNFISNNNADKGGGVYCENSNTMIDSNTIIDNSAYFGGGIYCNETCYPTISNNIIRGNDVSSSGSEGGGIYCHTAFPTISDNTIDSNVANLFGGGIYCYNSYGITVSDNIISENETPNNGSLGGGIYAEDCSLMVVNNTISGNESIHSGGGIYCANNVFVLINENSVIGNYSDWGGGIYCSDSSSTSISYNIIRDNTAIEKGGGIVCHEYSRPYISFNLIRANSAGFTGGGGIYCEGGSYADIINNTITENFASNDGGGIYCQLYSNVEIVNTILWADSANSEYNEIYLPSGGLDITYSDIQGSWEGEGNINCDPWFCDPVNLDYHLTDSSCCVGAGEGGVNIGAYDVGCGIDTTYKYLPGDVNMFNGAWQPMVIGGDVTYLVNYFRGMESSIPCLLGGFWCSADANGDCSIIGSDVTKLVNYFRGESDISWCPDYEPGWLHPDDLPTEPPSGWPNCE
ncbi:MAG: hypothetical protein GY839_10275 [candidate division Zixibacteria bacterium]|nr:hypothetical protein [candidate division Zixibacteria bacterium]